MQPPILEGSQPELPVTACCPAPLPWLRPACLLSLGVSSRPSASASEDPGVEGPFDSATVVGTHTDDLTGSVYDVDCPCECLQQSASNAQLLPNWGAGVPPCLWYRGTNTPPVYWTLPSYQGDLLPRPCLPPQAAG